MNWLKTRKLESGIILVGLLCIHAFLLTDAFRGSHINADKAGVFGDFIGGYIGTLFGLASIVLIIATLKEQIKQTTTEGFERRFFQLLDYHRQNVAALSVGERSGHHIFVTLIREFREIHKLVTGLVGVHDPDMPNLQRINLSYIVFYYGTGPNSNRILRASLTNYKPSLIEAALAALDNSELKDAVMRQRNFGFTPFEGHQSRLGHYFRHLYQTACYIDDRAHIARQDYANLLRAQLSNHEQALLAINSLSDVGTGWRKRALLERYHLIRNVPKSFFDPQSEIDLQSQVSKIAFEHSDEDDAEPNRS